ncbi:hypothetical protein B0H15DRAFT_1024732 [Mycena belliarum]|uniref:MYND-type domain-containing protein n=1 Tax=Mycena belliarum TaxID=1033014 RepID=A0AAD6XKZ0_9AGAR|nr:hypothetical protein B0H15DRAFT_1024732 [Mycena belliae]
MEGGPRPVVDVVRSLLALSRGNYQALDPNKVLDNLLELSYAIKRCPFDQFEPITTIEALTPYLAPFGARYADTVVEKTDIDVFQTKFAGASINVLASIVHRFRYTPLWPAIMQRLVVSWASTCMGLRFYARTLLRTGPPAAPLEIDSPAQTFTIMITLLKMYADADALASLVHGTREATDLVIKFWVIEIESAQLSVQLVDMFQGKSLPTTAGLLDFCVFAQRDPESAGSLIISMLDGSLGPERIAYVALEHLSRSTLALSQSTESATLSVVRMNLHILTCLHSKPFHLMLLSQNSVGAVTEALLSLTSVPFDPATTDIIADCIALICKYLRMHIACDGLTSLNYSLESGLLVGLVKAHPWLGAKWSLDPFVELLAVHLPRYLIYLSVLRQVDKSLKAFEQLDLRYMLSSVQTFWKAFEKDANVHIALATEAELASATCSNCNKAPTFRCSSCLEALYCSKACQIAVWNTHITTCNAHTTAFLNGVTPDLPDSDIQFALRVARHDFEQHKAQICAKWRASGTLPLRAGIDYSVFPHTTRVGIDVPPAVSAQGASNAAIYAVFPQGTAEAEYYMCDLGLTREAGVSDEEAIAMVVQMISAQPVPAFCRVK